MSSFHAERWARLRKGGGVIAALGLFIATTGSPTVWGQESSKASSEQAPEDRWTTGDLWDPIKYIPLTADGFIWTSFGGQARLRFEAWNNFGASEVGDEELLLGRTRIHNDTHIGDHLRFFIEGISALSTESDFRAGGLLDVNSLDLQQAYVDLEIPFDRGEGPQDDLTLTLRVGRQEMAFGKQRLVSPLDWSNTRRTWDGIKATVDCAGWSVSSFWTQFVLVDKYECDRADAQHPFWGVHATGPAPVIPGATLDLYYLARDRQDSVTGRGDERHTLGGRLSGKIGKSGLDYDLEGAYQLGDRNTLGVAAHFISGELGYAPAEAPGAPRLFLGADYASGDEDPGDSKFNTFDQLFPLGHAYFGYIDLIGRQNIVAGTLGVSFTPMEKLTALVQGHVFCLADESAGLFNAGGGPVSGKAGTRDVGQEIDVLLAYQWDIHTQIQVGYSRFFAGNYFALPGRDDVSFFYFSWQYTF